MKQELIETLETLGYPVRLQGSFSENEAYPDTFFTIWNGNTEDAAHYDNNAVSYVWNFSVYVYSTDPQKVNTLLLEAKAALKENRWIVGGKGYDVQTDYPSHTGRAIDIQYLELEKGEEPDAECGLAGNS